MGRVASDRMWDTSGGAISTTPAQRGTPQETNFCRGQYSVLTPILGAPSHRLCGTSAGGLQPWVFICIGQVLRMDSLGAALLCACPGPEYGHMAGV